MIKKLLEEISRCEELAKLYCTIPNGGFALAHITSDITKAKAALADGDTVAMVRMCKVLEGKK